MGTVIVITAVNVCVQFKMTDLLIFIVIVPPQLTGKVMLHMLDNIVNMKQLRFVQRLRTKMEIIFALMEDIVKMNRTYDQII